MSERVQALSILDKLSLRNVGFAIGLGSAALLSACGQSEQQQPVRAATVTSTTELHPETTTTFEVPNITEAPTSTTMARKKIAAPASTTTQPRALELEELPPPGSGEENWFINGAGECVWTGPSEPPESSPPNC